MAGSLYDPSYALRVTLLAVILASPTEARSIESNLSRLIVLFFAFVHSGFLLTVGYHRLCMYHPRLSRTSVYY